MKTRNILAFLCVCALGAISCDKSAYKYEPAAPVDENKTIVAFSADDARYLDLDGADVTLTVKRTVKTGALTVNIALNDTSKLFTLPATTVAFADGEDEATVTVSYSYEKLKLDTTYYVEVSIDDASVTSDFGLSVFPLTCLKAWKNLGVAQFCDLWFFGAVWEKELRQHPDGLPVYRIIQPWAKDDIIEEGFDFTDELPYLEFEIKDGVVTYPNLIDLGFQLSGRDCVFFGPANAAAVAKMNLDASGFVMDKLIEFNWLPFMLQNGKPASWWGQASSAYLSLPGGPDLNILLSEED